MTARYHSSGAKAAANKIIGAATAGEGAGGIAVATAGEDAEGIAIATAGEDAEGIAIATVVGNMQVRCRVSALRPAAPPSVLVIHSRDAVPALDVASPLLRNAEVIFVVMTEYAAALLVADVSAQAACRAVTLLAPDYCRMMNANVDSLFAVAARLFVSVSVTIAFPSRISSI